MRSTIFIGMFLWVVTAVCQNQQTLNDAITQFASQQHLNISFDVDLLSKISSGTFDEISIDSLSNYLESNYPLSIQNLDNNYYIITLSKSVYLIQLSDSLSKKPLFPEISSVLVNGKAIPSRINKGSLEFDYLPTTKDTLSIYAPGYEAKTISFIQLINDREFQLSFTPIFVELNTVLIRDYITEGIDLNPANQSVNIDVGSLPLLPGETDGDIFASLSALPGISTPDNRAGNLYIRGSSTDQSYVMLDNIPIYSRGHYFGTISPYNPKIVEEVEVHRNGFHPRMGGRVGGAIEIKTDGGEDNEISGGLGMNSLFTMGYLQSPILDKKAGLSIGVRRSFPTSFVSPKLEAITEMVYAGSAVTNVNTGELLTDVEVTFEDYQASLNVPIGTKNNLYISSIYTNSLIEYEVTDQNAPTIPEQTSNSNIGLSAKWTNKINQQLSSNLEFSYSHYDLRFLANEAINSQATDVRGTFSINTILDLALSEELSWAMANKNQFDFGLEYRQQNVADRYKGACTGTNPDYLRSSNQIATTVSPYLNYSFNNWEKWYVQIGSRLNYYNLINDVSFAPRLFANYAVSNSFSFKGTTGLYFQYLSQVKGLEFSSGGFDNEVWVLADQVYSKPISGSQSMFGFTWSKKDWVIDMETFYKRANNVAYYTANRLAEDEFFVQNDHEIKGYDFFIKKRINNHLDSWAGYSYSDFKVLMDTATYNSRYSQPHSANIGLSFHKNNFKLSTGWRITSGLEGNSAELAYKRRQFYEGRRNVRDPFTSLAIRYPMVHFWDLSASYNLPENDNRKWSSTIGLSLINIYNQENLTDQVVRAGASAGNPNFVDRDALGFAPNLMVTVEW